MPITKRTKPLFRLTNSIELTVKRFPAGEMVKGKWVKGDPIDMVVEVNIQPMQYEDLLSLPESDRTKEWLKLYSREELREAREGDGGYDADIVMWEGYEYKVMKSQSYKMGVLDHSKVLAARTPISALPL